MIRMLTKTFSTLAIGSLLAMFLIQVTQAHTSSNPNGAHRVRIGVLSTVHDEDGGTDDDDDATGFDALSMFLFRKNRGQTPAVNRLETCAHEARVEVHVSAQDLTRNRVRVLIDARLYQADAGGCGLDDLEDQELRRIVLAPGEIGVQQDITLTSDEGDSSGTVRVNSQQSTF